MKYIERNFYITLLILLTVFISHKGPGPAESSTSTASQTVSVTFPAIRALYVDDYNNIVAILNNSPVISDEMLAVYRNGVEMPLYKEIKEQYRELLEEVDFSQVGWVYKDSFPERLICSEIKSNNFFREVSSNDNEKIKFPPAPPHKDNYSVRMTVFDIEENVRGISITSL